jgi:hypothetical protein
MFTGMYYGDGTSKRTITTDCPFEARVGFVFANNRTISISRYSESKSNNYLGFFGYFANSLGVKLEDDCVSITVQQSPMALTSNEYINLNEQGVAYHYIMFR